MIDKLKDYSEKKLVTCQKHPTHDLFIYNYTPRVQYEKLWDEITLQCRGLIVNESGEVIARPFGKFFNLEELTPEQIPNKPFEVYDKLDGSLGILYWIDNAPRIATRGSFSSVQAIKATQILHHKYFEVCDKLDKNLTYLFEIIYPENRIVVDYKGREDLILLAIIDTKTGNDLPLQDVGFPVVKRYDGINDLSKIRELENTSDEGFVIKFSNGFRMKVKFSEYVRLHRIITGISNVVIWEYLSTNQSFDELLERVPDEFYNYVKETKSKLIDQYRAIELECQEVFKAFETRKETAEYFKTQKHPSILFNMLDEKPYDKAIWKFIRPVFCKPFMIEA